MTWFETSPTRWITVVGFGTLGCGGLVDVPGAGNWSPTSGGAIGAVLGGASSGGALEPATATTGGVPSTSSIGGTSAAGTSSASVGGAPAKSCEYPIAPLPSGGVACPSNIGKGMPCTNEGAVCYKPCGPAASGWKSETCTVGVYTEVSTCIWTATDYSAFRVPTTATELDPTCPTIASVGVSACTVAPCKVCPGPPPDITAVAADTLATKWCVCVELGGLWKWSCGIAESSWPCPQAVGC